MSEKIEKLIQTAYKKWRQEQADAKDGHPEEEILACFLEGKLSPQEQDLVMEHLLSCARCAEAVAVRIKTKAGPEKELPAELKEWARGLLSQGETFLEIILKIKEKALEILHTSGDILVGQELVPAPVWRSRQAKDLKEPVTILKDFPEIRVEIKIENKQGASFSLSLGIKEKNSQNALSDLRVTLLRDDIELESYLSENGRAFFDNILPGKYTVEIFTLENRLALIALEVNT